MPAFTRDLERTLQRALSIADEKGHAEAGPAHLALALTYDGDAKEVFRACAVDVAALKVSLHHLADATIKAPLPRRASAAPSAGMRQIVQRALIHAKASGREHLAGPHMLIALLGDPDDGAAEILRHAGVTRFDAVRFVSHGLKKWQGEQEVAEAPPCDPGEAVRVLLLNDDFTPMEFVVGVLRNVFDRTEDEAVRLMLEIHKAGFAQCGAYPSETAAAKVAAVARLARDHQHPLHCVMEPVRGPSDALLFKKPRAVVASGSGDRQRA